MSEGKGNVVGYVIVMILLALYFGWLMDRMALFSDGGVSRLAKLGAGLVIGLLALAVTFAAGKLASRRGGSDERERRGGGR